MQLHKSSMLATIPPRLPPISRTEASPSDAVKCYTRTWKIKWCVFFFVWIQAWSWFCFMTILDHMLPGWHLEAHWLKIGNFCPFIIFSWSLIPLLWFFQASGTFLHQKTFYSKGKEETAIKDFLTSKPLEFYHTSINNLDWWLKCIDVQRLYFDWLDHCLNSLIQDF